LYVQRSVANGINNHMVQTLETEPSLGSVFKKKEDQEFQGSDFHPSIALDGSVIPGKNQRTENEILGSLEGISD
jgi:hypothetical protein